MSENGEKSIHPNFPNNPKDRNPEISSLSGNQCSCSPIVGIPCFHVQWGILSAYLLLFFHALLDFVAIFLCSQFTLGTIMLPEQHAIHKDKL